jgi:glycosyltransferase involved in cell wall biosynthesis
LGSGTPVLISNRVNIWREISGDGAALICDDTEDSVLEKIREWLKLAPTERTHMRLRARKCFEKHFTIGQSVSQLDAVLERSGLLRGKHELARG